MADRFPISNELLAKIVRKGGSRLLDEAVARLTPEAPAKRSIGGKVLGGALVRIASRSVPGAILVGGGLIARALHRRHMEKRKG